MKILKEGAITTNQEQNKTSLTEDHLLANATKRWILIFIQIKTCRAKKNVFIITRFHVSQAHYLFYM